MVYFNYENAPKEWFCHWNKGCILFALINGGYIPSYLVESRLRNFFKTNLDFKKLSIEEKILYQLKAITLWALITGYYPLGHKETFYTMYKGFMKLLRDKEKFSPKDYRKRVLNYMRKITTLCDFFANHDGNSLNDGTWNAGNHLRLTAETFTSLEDLPYKSLLCIDKKHWVVYLGAYDENTAIVLDSDKCDGYMKVSATDLYGQRIIKPKNIYCDARICDAIEMFDDNPRDLLDSMRRREFSTKMAELMKRLDEISFTEHDYNRYLKLSRGFLESLDKEHYRYEL